MGYAVGKAPTADGTGTTPEDFQRWIWSLYRTGGSAIAAGGEVSGTSKMAYSVEPAAAILSSGDRRRYVALSERVTVPTAAAPSSGSRTDYIYVGGDGAVMVGSSQPTNTALLDKRLVPAGITATTATTSLLGDRRFAPLRGASMGPVLSWGESLAHLGTIPAAWTTVMSKTLTLDEDRTLDWRHFMTAAIQQAADGVFSSVQWQLSIDGAVFKTWEFKVDNIAETRYFAVTGVLTAGTHTVTLRRRVRRNPTNVVSYYRGGDESWPGTNLTCVDLGGAV